VVCIKAVLFLYTQVTNGKADVVGLYISRILQEQTAFLDGLLHLILGTEARLYKVSIQDNFRDPKIIMRSKK
jgi:hypothetical protein